MNNRSTLQPADVTALTGADQTISGVKVLLGIVGSDNGSGAFKVHVFHGTSDADPHIAAIYGQSGHSMMMWFGPNGLRCPNGIYIKVVSGTVIGSIFSK